jgi:phosphocarrier protein
MISNETGLHALAATRFAQKAASYDAEVQVEKDGQRVDGKNIISMLALLADKGTTITISSRGDDAPEALRALGSLIESRFDKD